jgi:glycosyltransferase involved in cell wall biosynthesis
MKLVSIPKGNIASNFDSIYIEQCHETDAALIVMNADLICHLIDVREKLPPIKEIDSLPTELQALCKKYRKKIGSMFWELPVFPGKWCKSFDEIDEIWTSSKFIKESMGSATNKPVKVVPLAVPLNFTDPTLARKALNLPLDKKLFLITFDFNSFPERKNSLGAIKAYCDAFDANKRHDAILIVKCQGDNNRAGYLQNIKAITSLRNDIMLLDQTYTFQQMQFLQAAIDVYVSLHRSEGFGLNIAECMAAGKIVIATGYSGNTDFMEKSNSIPIDYSMINVGANQYIEHFGQFWAEPSHEEAVSAMKLCMNEGSQLTDIANAARNTVKYNLSYERIGELMKSNI